MPLVKDVILRDGSVLRLRAPEPGDEAAIKDFFDRFAQEEAYGEAMLELRARKKLQSLLGEDEK